MATVFVLSNQSLGGMVKIGCTQRTAATRAAELSGGATPTPFRVEYETGVMPLERARQVEKKVFANKVGSRIERGEQFFKMSVKEAADAVQEAVQEIENEGKAATGAVTVTVPKNATTLVIKFV